VIRQETSVRPSSLADILELLAAELVFQFICIKGLLEVVLSRESHRSPTVIKENQSSSRMNRNQRNLESKKLFKRLYDARQRY
jgi:hypothetical protein